MFEKIQVLQEARGKYFVIYKVKFKAKKIFQNIYVLI